MTILVDLTPLVDGRGPARLLDMRPGRSADVLSGWLKERDPSFREQIQVVTMDGFTGYATAVEEQLPQADKVMDPFHVVHLAADKLTSCRQRLQRETTGRRGRKDDPLYKHRRTLWRRRNDVLAYFDIGASNGPVEALNGRLEHLRGIALGFKNLNHYILRCLIHSRQLQDKINAL